MLEPKGGEYDLQLRDRGGWRTALRDSPKASVKVATLDGACRVRARTISAAGVPSRWRAAGLC